MPDIIQHNLSDQEDPIRDPLQSDEDPLQLDNPQMPKRRSNRIQTPNQKYTDYLE